MATDSGPVDSAKTSVDAMKSSDVVLHVPRRNVPSNFAVDIRSTIAGVLGPKGLTTPLFRIGISADSRTYPLVARWSTSLRE